MGLPSLSFSDTPYPGATAATSLQTVPQKGNCAIWLNVLRDSEKSQLSSELKTVLFDKFAIPAVAIDGEQIQQELCRDLGYCGSDQSKSMQRVAEVAKLIMDSGVFTIISCQTPLAETREAARKILAPNHIVEVRVHTATSAQPTNIEHINQKNTNAETVKFREPQQYPECDADFEIVRPHFCAEQATALIIQYLEENFII